MLVGGGGEGGLGGGGCCCCCAMGCWIGVPEPDAEQVIGICDGLRVSGFGVVLAGTACVVLEEAIGCVVGVICVNELEDALGWVGQV